MTYEKPPSEEVLKVFNEWLDFQRDLSNQRHEREMEKLKVREKEASIKTKLVPYFSKADKIFIISVITFIFGFVLIPMFLL